MGERGTVLRVCLLFTTAIIAYDVSASATIQYVMGTVQTQKHGIHGIGLIWHLLRNAQFPSLIVIIQSVHRAQATGSDFWNHWSNPSLQTGVSNFVFISLIDREVFATPPPSPITLHLERRQIERIPTVLQPEYAQQETVHTKQHTGPQEHCKRLGARILNPRNLDSKGNSRESKYTVDGSNNLTLKTILVAEATSKIAHTTLAITNNIRRLANVVEHVARREKQDGNKGDGSPEIAVL
jgi:hypothetical protein